mgnify:CR=1 FL=1
MEKPISSRVAATSIPGFIRPAIVEQFCARKEVLMALLAQQGIASGNVHVWKHVPTGVEPPPRVPEHSVHGVLITQPYVSGVFPEIAHQPVGCIFLAPFGGVQHKNSRIKKLIARLPSQFAPIFQAERRTYERIDQVANCKHIVLSNVGVPELGYVAFDDNIAVKIEYSLVCRPEQLRDKQLVVGGFADVAAWK